MSDEFLTIGKLANMFNMDVQMLRYYDAKGILIPEVRDPNNNRRYYSINQIYRLATIRYLRRLGYSLSQIGEFISMGGFEERTETLREQSAMLRKQYEKLIQTDNIIQEKLAFIQLEYQNLDVEGISVKTYPERTFMPIGPESSLFTHELFHFYPTVGFYQDDKKWFGAYLYPNAGSLTPPHALSAAQASQIAPGRYVCGYHKGPYQTIHESIARIQAKSAGMPLDGLIVVINIIDQFVASDPADYITEIQLRILDELY